MILNSIIIADFFFSPTLPGPRFTENATPQVKARLHTLEYLYNNSGLVLSTEQIKRLWACLGPGVAVPASDTSAEAAAAAEEVMGVGVGATGRATPGEVSTLLSWLSKACEACEGEGGGGMFEPGVAAELFKVGGLMCGLCYADVFISGVFFFGV